ncbi:MAG TPA: sigma-70 family RNA polymerase sigma factor [Actinomycetota bacterium]|nr:sigma-70 family RNA polymerase sigma factor [Actinomycetota bacterium]
MSGHDERDRSDDDLVRRFQEGQDEAFAELMRRHERRVYNLAYRMLGNAEEALDAAQETFLSCFRNVVKFRGDSAFSTWLHRIAVNVCYDSLRKRSARPVEAIRFHEPVPAADHGDQTAIAVDVQRALLAVSPEFRAVLILHEIQDVPVEEIAAALDLPVGTVKSRLHRGRVALGRALAGEPESTRPPSKAGER